jgi:hypothetical protein
MATEVQLLTCTICEGPAQPAGPFFFATLGAPNAQIETELHPGFPQDPAGSFPSDCYTRNKDECNCLGYEYRIQRSGLLACRKLAAKSFVWTFLQLSHLE